MSSSHSPSTNGLVTPSSELTNGNGHIYGAEESIPHTKEKNLPGGGNWVVQKFGGTSVGKFALNIADIVQKGLVKNRIAVVCSARSSHSKLEGTTNRLLRAAKAAETLHGSKQYTEIVVQIEEDHINAAKLTIKNPDLLASYIDQVKAECKSLSKILESAQHLEEVSRKAENKIISKGEKLACRYMATLLSDRDVPAQFVDLSDVIKRYNVPSLTKDGAYKELALALGQEVLACGDKVPVVTGYFGHVPDGLLHSIGRGYTDLCAALVAIGTSAQELQVWKEVDGIFTADPRKVPTARLLPSVSPSEAAELTFYGSEVIHPFTMEQVIKARIPIRIKNVMNPRGQGTVILPDAESLLDTTHPQIFRGRSSSSLNTLYQPKRPTAVTIKHSIVVLNIHSNRRTRAHGFLANIFSILDKHHLSVDLISSSEVHVSMALHSEYSMLAGGTTNDSAELKIQDLRLHGAVEDLAKLGNVDLVADMAIVSLVGKQLKNMTGISGKFFSVLGDNNINIEMISQGALFFSSPSASDPPAVARTGFGCWRRELCFMNSELTRYIGASEINISCVIWERDADRALNVVHTSLFTFLE
ncbi:aspartate kinase [Tothia fuscella]|uniref:aspartate kinase n=1 Tax=Tothia fuscella TaxID=1048955 RepID=A0A9P4TYB4_9PEZI|nr:aspartate kinase [Tothia fuscella]